MLIQDKSVLHFCSQLIIITGPSYEALASDGIQLSVGAGDAAQDTCAVIRDIAYHQEPESKLQATEDEDRMTGVLLGTVDPARCLLLFPMRSDQVPPNS